MLLSAMMSGLVASPVWQMCRNGMTSVWQFGMTCRGNPPNVAAPALPASTIVVTPEYTPPRSGWTPVRLQPSKTCAWRSIRPGATILPATSIVRVASALPISRAMWAITPPCTGTSWVPSSPVDGSTTVPLLSKRSYMSFLQWPDALPPAQPCQPRLYSFRRRRRRPTGKEESMKLGICIPHYGRPIEVDRMLAVAQRAEEVGLDSIWVTDHVIVPRDVDVIYREDMLDPLAVLPCLAGVTERIALGTSVIILPYRSPIPVAKLLASVDVLSGGRLIVGAAIGWMEGEFAALGIPFQERVSRSEERSEER